MLVTSSSLTDGQKPARLAMSFVPPSMPSTKRVVHSDPCLASAKSAEVRLSLGGQLTTAVSRPQMLKRRNISLNSELTRHQCQASRGLAAKNAAAIASNSSWKMPALNTWSLPCLDTSGHGGQQNAGCNMAHLNQNRVCTRPPMQVRFDSAPP